jgi:Flp pilus assembly protein TadD
MVEPSEPYRRALATLMGFAVANPSLRVVHFAIFNLPYAAAFTGRSGRAITKAIWSAVADFSEAIRFDPNDALAMSWRGAVRKRLGGSEAGNADLAAARKIDRTTGARAGGRTRD